MNKAIPKEWIEDILEKFHASPSSYASFELEPSESRLFVHLRNQVASRLHTHLLQQQQQNQNRNQVTPQIVQELMQIKFIQHLHDNVVHKVRAIVVQEKKWLEVAQGVVRRHLRAQSLQRPSEELVSMNDLMESLNHMEDGSWDR